MQESKINSTLKISILMAQVDGERNYVAPPLKTAPVFGGIAGFVANDTLEPADATADAQGQVPSLNNKSRDMLELQDVYRRALAASWASQPGELPADQCIEDIFAGGNGFQTGPAKSLGHKSSRSRTQNASPRKSANAGNSPPSTSSSGGNNIQREDSGETSDEDDNGDMMGTLRPRDMARLRLRLRSHSSLSDRSTDTVLGDRDRDGNRGLGLSSSSPHRDLTQVMHQHQHHHHRRERSKDNMDGGLRSRSDSATSLATTVGSERGRDGFKRTREVDEFEMREDLVAWAIQGVPT
ncbi:hypothetical protein B0T25DRAFT_527361 [Lasiosphaeria hispida]|uniref:Uncharacterized protein n=1 Tax=Lasiosphaeria hispida TaxID=260671 RepID=A0AAJ0HVE8_9PEZI|nr:hypothetical protein B0T25DRAFT_527361 [Lasiosphaeria hispida]